MVWVGSGPKAGPDEEEKNYEKESKNEYSKRNVVFWVFATIFFLIFFFISRGWVEAENKEEEEREARNSARPDGS